jgi:hypothetical protein
MTKADQIMEKFDQFLEMTVEENFIKNENYMDAINSEGIN